MNRTASEAGPHLVPAPSPHKAPRLRQLPTARQAHAPKLHRRLSVIQQIRVSFQPKRRLAAAVGTLLGGFVPLATSVVAHHEVDRAPTATIWQLPLLLVAGGLVFSALTVYTWCTEAFQARTKAVGFVVLAEGVMILSHVEWLSTAALCYLISINAIATAATLALAKK